MIMGVITGYLGGLFFTGIIFALILFVSYMIVVDIFYADEETEEKTDKKIRRIYIISICFAIFLTITIPIFTSYMSVLEKNAEIENKIEEIVSFQSLYTSSLNDTRLSGLERVELVKLADISNKTVVELQNLIKYKRNTIMLNSDIISRIEKLEQIS